jgi:hypothetical protein
MGAPGQRLFVACLQSFQTVFADRLQHHEPRFTFRLVHLLHEALVYHRRHAVEQVYIQIALVVARSFHSFQAASANEYR